MFNKLSLNKEIVKYLLIIGLVIILTGNYNMLGNLDTITRAVISIVK